MTILTHNPKVLGLNKVLAWSKSIKKHRSINQSNVGKQIRLRTIAYACTRSFFVVGSRGLDMELASEMDQLEVALFIPVTRNLSV